MVKKTSTSKNSLAKQKLPAATTTFQSAVTRAGETKQELHEARYLSASTLDREDLSKQAALATAMQQHEQAVKEARQAFASLLESCRGMSSAEVSKLFAGLLGFLIKLGLAEIVVGEMVEKIQEFIADKVRNITTIPHWVTSSAGSVAQEMLDKAAVEKANAEKAAAQVAEELWSKALKALEEARQEVVAASRELVAAANDYAEIEEVVMAKQEQVVVVDKELYGYYINITSAEAEHATQLRRFEDLVKSLRLVNGKIVYFERQLAQAESALHATEAEAFARREEAIHAPLDDEYAGFAAMFAEAEVSAAEHYHSVLQHGYENSSAERDGVFNQQVAQERHLAQMHQEVADAKVAVAEALKVRDGLLEELSQAQSRQEALRQELEQAARQFSQATEKLTGAERDLVNLEKQRASTYSVSQPAKANIPGWQKPPADLTGAPPVYSTKPAIRN